MKISSAMHPLNIKHLVKVSICNETWLIPMINSTPAFKNAVRKLNRCASFVLVSWTDEEREAFIFNFEHQFTVKL